MDIAALVYKVLDGRGTDEEKAQLDSWRTQSKENEEVFEDLKLLWENSLEPSGIETHDPSFYDGLNKIQAVISEKKVEKKKIRRRNIRIALLLIVLGILALIYFSSQSLKKPTALRFENEKFERVLERIRDEYEIIIKVENESIGSCRITAIFYGEIDGDALVKSLAATLGLEFRQVGQKSYLITGGTCRIN